METNLNLVTSNARLKELKFGSVWVHISYINRGNNILGDGWDIFTKKDSVLFWLERKKQGGNKAKKGRGWLGKVLPSWGTDVQIEIQQRSNSRGRKRDGTGKKNKMKKQQLWLGFIALLPPCALSFLCLPPPPCCCRRWGLERINSVLSHERNVSFLQ